MFGFLKKKEEEAPVILDKNLYILCDVQKPGFVNYMENNGIHVKCIETEPSRVTLRFIRENMPIRLVVIDYGTGRFKLIEQIDAIVGLISTANNKLGEDEAGNCTVFTKSGALIKELRDGKYNVDIKEYRGGSDVVKTLLSYNESYVTSGAKDINGESEETLIGYQYSWSGDRQSVGCKNSTVDSNDIIDKNFIDGDESIESFKVKF